MLSRRYLYLDTGLWRLLGVRQCWRQEGEGLRWRSAVLQAGQRRTWGRKGSTTAAPAASLIGVSSSTGPLIEVRCASQLSAAYFISFYLCVWLCCLIYLSAVMWTALDFFFLQDSSRFTAKLLYCCLWWFFLLNHLPTSERAAIISDSR